MTRSYYITRIALFYNHTLPRVLLSHVYSILNHSIDIELVYDYILVYADQKPLDQNRSHSDYISFVYDKEYNGLQDRRC